MSADASARSSAAAEPARAALTVEFDTDAPVLNVGASRALLGLLLASDPERAITNADKTSPVE